MIWLYSDNWCVDSTTSRWNGAVNTESTTFERNSNHRKCCQNISPPVLSAVTTCKILVRIQMNFSLRHWLRFLNASVWVVRYGMSDLKGILRSAKKKDYVMYVVYLVESSIAKVNSDLQKYKRSPDAIVQSTIIFDMEGFSMQHITNKQGINRLTLVSWFSDLHS